MQLDEKKNERGNAQEQLCDTCVVISWWIRAGVGWR